MGQWKNNRRYCKNKGQWTEGTMDNGRTKDWRDKGLEGQRTGGTKDWRDKGLEGQRTGGTKDWRDKGLEG
jgi:hypothetical protein